MFQRFDPLARFRTIDLPATDKNVATGLDLDERFPKLIGLEGPASKRFAGRKVAVVGVGSVGRRLALHLARLGIEILWLIDPGRYDDRANLLTQAILATDLGKCKAESTGEACKAISPATRVLAYEGRLQDLDPVLMAQADTVFLATDNLAVEVDASQQFRLLGIPVIQASVHGETLVTQVRFLENRRADGPCLICSFGPIEYQHLNRSSIFSCTGAGNVPDEQINVLPTTSTSFLCSLAADLAMAQWTRHTLGLGQPVTDTLLQYCGYTHRVTQAELKHNSNCASAHTVLERAAVHEPLEACTTGDLARSAGFDEYALKDLSFTLDKLSYVQSAVCRCDTYPVNRFLLGGETLGRCSACDEAITPQPHYTSRPTSGSDLLSQREQPLMEFGGADVAWAVVSCDQCGVLLHNADVNSTTNTVLETCHEA